MSDSPLDFDGTPPSASEPRKPVAKRPAGKKAKGPAAGPAAVICQRCEVPCEPVPGSRGWQQCPKCRWKHKPMDKVQALKAARTAALRAAQERTAR